MEKTYTEKEVEQIKKDFTNTQILQFAKQMETLISNNFITEKKKNLFSNKFNKQTVKQYLENPQKHEKELRLLSLVLTTLSPQYKQIVSYLPSICKFIPVAIPNMDKYSNVKGQVSDVEKIRKDYLKVSSLIEKMNIPHEFSKITSICIRDDLFFGYIHEDNDSFYIQQLDTDYCKISTISQGCFNMAFDFSYFDKNKNIKDLGNLIDYYPEEFQQKYKLYEKNKTNNKWQEIDLNKTIVMKFNEELPFGFPEFCSLFSDLSDLNDYKDLLKSKTATEAYRFIGMQLPLNDKSGKEDDFMVSVQTAMQFYTMLCNNLPEGVGAFLSATPWKDVNFGGGNVSAKDEVNNAETSLFLSTGISPVAFGKNATSATGLNTSNTIDSARVFKFYRQLERWLSRKIHNDFNMKFNVKLLDVTVHNEKNIVDEYLKLAQYGVPVKLYLSAIANVNQSNERGLTFLEDSVLNLVEEWKPLQSSHTQSGDVSSEVGAPEKDVTDLKDSGEKSRDTESSDFK